MKIEPGGKLVAVVHPSKKEPAPHEEIPGRRRDTKDPSAALDHGPGGGSAHGGFGWLRFERHDFHSSEKEERRNLSHAGTNEAIELDCATA